MTVTETIHPVSRKTEPLCPVFGTCGGCRYQDVPYPEELRLKEEAARRLIGKEVAVGDGVWDRIVPSSREYHYRHRLDMKLLRTKKGEVFMGFSPRNGTRIVPVDACPLGMEPVSDFLPLLKETAARNMPPKYRNANLVVKTGDDGRVFWGGIGRRSLRQGPEDYLWTEVNGRRIFYSLDTFFQANLSILGRLIQRILDMDILGPATTLYDLYGGVGLFGVGLYHKVKNIVLIEENPASVTLARYNFRFHQIGNFRIIQGRVEEELPHFGPLLKQGKSSAVIDPPRQGLSRQARALLPGLKSLNHLMYLSCSPEALARDLKLFQSAGWHIRRIIPFDFFPRTQHLEILAVLSP